MLTVRAPARFSQLTGAAGALLLQGGFVLLFLYSMPQISRPIETGRELNQDCVQFAAQPAALLQKPLEQLGHIA